MVFKFGDYGYHFLIYHFLVAFRMYDLDGDGAISREELLAVLHMMVGANISEEQVRFLTPERIKSE